jgi:hypothetical protein
MLEGIRYLPLGDAVEIAVYFGPLQQTVLGNHASEVVW